MAAVAGGPAAAAPGTLLGTDDFGHWKEAEATHELKGSGGRKDAFPGTSQSTCKQRMKDGSIW